MRDEEEEEEEEEATWFCRSALMWARAAAAAVNTLWRQRWQQIFHTELLLLNAVTRTRADFRPKVWDATWVTAYYNLYLWQVKSTFTDVKQFHHQLFLILPPGNHLYLEICIHIIGQY
jgi:hypothetical protein